MLLNSLVTIGPHIKSDKIVIITLHRLNSRHPFISQEHVWYGHMIENLIK